MMLSTHYRNKLYRISYRIITLYYNKIIEAQYYLFKLLIGIY